VPTAYQGYRNAAGEIIPGCTTVMKALSTGSTDGLCYWAAKLAKQGLFWKDERDRAGKLGSHIHDLLERYPDIEVENPGWMTPDEFRRVEAAVAAYSEWEATVEPVVLHREVQLVSEQLQFGGCFDAIVEIGGKPVLLDHKTGKSADKMKWAIQLGAYRWLVQENKLIDRPIERGLVLHYPDGKFRPVEIDGKELDAGLNLFGIAREAYDAMKRFPS
jgi:hypothetical protein